MSNLAALITAAENYLRIVDANDDRVLAAGIFGLQDDYKVIFATGAVTSAALDATGMDSPLIAGIGGAAAVHAAREINAAQHGLPVRMVIAVTATNIHVLDGADGPVTTEFMRFSRNTTAVTVTKFGASRRIELADTANGQKLGITGSTGFLSSEAAADKTVIELLHG